MYMNGIAGTSYAGGGLHDEGGTIDDNSIGEGDDGAGVSDDVVDDQTREGGEDQGSCSEGERD